MDVNEFNKGKCSHFEPIRIAEETYQQFSYVFKENTFLNDYKGLQTPLNKFQYKRLENTEGKLFFILPNISILFLITFLILK